MENPQKSLETARVRFNQLVSALTSFNNALRSTPPDQLPPWSALQSHFNVLSSTLDSLSNTLTQHFPSAQTNPSALVSYPLPSFPAQAQEILLTTLLNKKLNPTVHEWVLGALNSDADDADADKQLTRLEELWENAGDIVAEIQDERNWYDDDHTLEEREEDEEEKGGGKEGLRLESMLRFMETGVSPGMQPPLPMAVVPGAGQMKR